MQTHLCKKLEGIQQRDARAIIRCECRNITTRVWKEKKKDIQQLKVVRCQGSSIMSCRVEKKEDIHPTYYGWLYENETLIIDICV